MFVRVVLEIILSVFAVYGLFDLLMPRFCVSWHERRREQKRAVQDKDLNQS